MSSYQKLNSSWSNRIGMLIDWLPLIAITAFSLSAFLVYVSMRSQIVPAVFNELNTIAEIKEEQLESWFNQQQNTVLEASEVLGESPQIVEILESGGINPEEVPTIEALLEEVDLLENSYSVSLLNQSSIIVYSTKGSIEGSYQPIQNTSTYLTPENRDQVVPNFYASRRDAMPMITFATPLHNEEDQRVGFLAVDLDLDALNQEMRKLPYTLELPSEEAPSLEVYLVGRISPEKNELVAHSVESHTLGDGISSPGIDEAILHRNSNQELYLNYNRNPVIGDYRWISEYNLALLSELKQYQIFAPARRLAAWIYGLGFSITALLSMILFLFKPKVKAKTNKL